MKYSLTRGGPRRLLVRAIRRIGGADDRGGRQLADRDVIGMPVGAVRRKRDHDVRLDPAKVTGNLPRRLRRVHAGERAIRVIEKPAPRGRRAPSPPRSARPRGSGRRCRGRAWRCCRRSGRARRASRSGERCQRLRRRSSPAHRRCPAIHHRDARARTAGGAGCRPWADCSKQPWRSASPDRVISRKTGEMARSGQT